MVLNYPFDTPPALDHSPEGERLLERAPVVRARMGDRDIWLALGYQAVRQVLSDQRFSREEATRPGGPVTTPSAANPEVLTSMDPPRHTRIRRLMAGAFSPRMVDRLELRVQQIVDDLLDELSPPADLVSQFTRPLPIMVICELLGVPYEDRDRIREWAEKLMALTAHSLEEIAEAARQTDEYLNGLIAARRDSPDDALISALIRVNDEGDHLSASELTTNLRMLLVGGHETTVNQLGNSMVTLFQHPSQLALLRHQPELLAEAVDELLRYSRLFTSVLPRVTTEEVDLEGTLIGAGEAVIPLISVANRDPRAFPDPHRFDMRRAGPAPHVALGHGPHFCMGAQLARLELRIAIGSLLRRFPDLRLAVDESALEWKKGMAVRTLKDLPVTW